MILNRSCNTFISSVIFNVLCFSSAYAEFDTQSNRTLEKRLHSIYVNHYQRPILESDWFKILDGIEVQTHRVQPGDTLWLISKVYFGDGHYWSKLWAVNKNITNPHLIFVGDTIYFSAGSYKNAPSIRVEKNQKATIITSSGDEGAVQDDSDGMNTVYEKPLVPLPDSFQESYVPVRNEESPINFVPRPQLRYISDFPLTKEILVAPQELVGKVRSLGKSRVITAESSLVLLSSRTGLIPGEVYSIVDSADQPVNEGYPLYIRASVRVLKKVDDELFEAKVIAQYSPINVGDDVSPYKIKIVSSDISSSRAPVEVPIRLVRDEKSVWASGDMLFFKTLDKGTVELGDVIKISNKYTEDIDFFVSNGYIKVVSVSPPFATGIVVTSREDIRKDSVSSPAYSGWPRW